jgi:hypothetical protein
VQRRTWLPARRPTAPARPWPRRCGENDSNYVDYFVYLGDGLATLDGRRLLVTEPALAVIADPFPPGYAGYPLIQDGGVFEFVVAPASGSPRRGGCWAFRGCWAAVPLAPHLARAAAPAAPGCEARAHVHTCGHAMSWREQ